MKKKNIAFTDCVIVFEELGWVKGDFSHIFFFFCLLSCKIVLLIIISLHTERERIQGHCISDCTFCFTFSLLHDLFYGGMATPHINLDDVHLLLNAFDISVDVFQNVLIITLQK